MMRGLAYYRPLIVGVILTLVIASLVGGAYIGYQRGYAESMQTSQPEVERLVSEIQTLMGVNANITTENKVLRKALPDLAGKTVKIGYIASDTTTYTVVKQFIEEVIRPDLNNYSRKLGVNVTFEFVIMDAEGQANLHLEHVQKLRSEGVDIFIGAGWSSQGCASLSYVRANKMLMFSPSSTSPTLAIADDPFFRMCPADTAMPPALANILWDYGIREVVVIQRGDSWGDGMMNLFAPLFTAKGGTVSKVVRYAAEEATDFCPYLLEARTLGEEAITRMGGDTSKVGVLLFSFDEASTLLKQVSQCEVLFNLTWFGIDGTARSVKITTDAPLEANQVKLISLLANAPNSTKYTEIGARYVAATGMPFSVYNGYLYDAAWVLAKSIIETGSENATLIASVLPEICETYYGATGWCRLNEYGDRAPPPYDIWYYAPGATAQSVSTLAGTYYPDNGVTVWNTR
jgi:branched-chain amino acid transport system substrate-binding protein